jgi:hypothetical protein
MDVSKELSTSIFGEEKFNLKKRYDVLPRSCYPRTGPNDIINQKATILIFSFFLYGAAALIGPWALLYKVP